MIYFDNAATTVRKPEGVAEAVVRAINSMGNAARGVHDNSLTAAREIYGAREKLAGLFGCRRADHVIFTANATEALNIAIHGLIRPGDHVITTELEHNSVLRPLYRLEREAGVKLSFVPADSQGRPELSKIETMIRPETRAIVCTHASNLTGNLVEIGRIGALARKKGVLFVVDASQTAGCIPVHMEEQQIDVVCFTGHKGLMGPQGTGGLCIREGVEVLPWKVGGSGVQSYRKSQPEEYPTRLEAGTLNGHGIAGLSAALDFIAETGLEEIGRRENWLARKFYLGVREIEGVKVYGDFSAWETKRRKPLGDAACEAGEDWDGRRNGEGKDLPVRAPIVALNIRDYDSGMVADVLNERYGIAVRAGAHCAPRMHEALGTIGQGAVRFSFSYFNREEEVEQGIRAVRELAGQ